jgi:flagellum-specific peptidoglycan hydrolase FlgJ
MKKVCKCLILVILGMIVGICVGTQLTKLFSRNAILKEEPVPVKLEQPEFFLYDIPNDSLVLQACAYYGLKHDTIILTQAKLETGNYKSYQCRVNNNLFGLYNSTKMEYYKFDHWSESVEAYKKWIQYRYKDGDYYIWLQTIGYAEDPDYISKLKFIRNTFIDKKLT